MKNTEYDQNLLQYLIQGVKDYAIFALDPSGKIITWNSGAERAKGYKAEEIVGKHFSIFYTDEAKKINHPDFELKTALKDGSYEEEGWRVRKDGTLFWAHVTITAIYADDGSHVGFAKVTRDLSERKKAQKSSVTSAALLRASEDVFELMVSSVKDYAIFVLSPEGLIKTWNAGAQRIKGYTANEVIGKHFSLFYTEDAKSIKHPEFELREAIKNGSYEEEGWRLRKDGTKFWASVTITAVKNADGGLEGFVKVTRDLTERKRYEEQLEQAKDEAILANQLKSKFVANITHEIRTPLSGIVGLSELIASDKKLPTDTQDSAQRIFDASRQLLTLLNDLLDFAKLEAGKLEIEYGPLHLATILDEVKGLTASKAKEKSLSISATIDETLPETLIGDATKIRQILLNLVHNSIKFTEKGGIDIDVERQDDTIMVTVTDTGIGVSEVIQSRLFTPFTQGHSSTAFGGTGLGLSICQQFVELLGGEIGMVSEPGEGTTVWFTLPLKEQTSK